VPVTGNPAVDARPLSAPASQQHRSIYRALSAEREVHERTVLLSARLSLSRPDSVFVETDGTFAPLSHDAAATIFVQVDGRPVTNESAIDWRGSAVPVRHSFNAVGATRLAAGRHTVELVAEPLAGTFSVSGASNLSVFVHPARRVASARLGDAAGPFDFTSLDRRGDAIPHSQLVAIPADVRQPVVALASGTARVAGPNGDSMLGIYLDRHHPGPGRSLWTVNDLWQGAELEGPVFTQAFLAGGRAKSTVSLDATEFPWRSAPPFFQDDNTVVYSVQSTAALAVLAGGLRVAGAGGPALPGFPDQADSAWDFACIGATSPWPGCPRTGENVLIGVGSFAVPRRHPGVVMLAAKARVQGDGADPGGKATLWITLDGVPRGSIGVQELRAPAGIGQRTISASYLATGKLALRPGRHVVRVYGRADGEFVHLTLSRDLPLVWFD
jgi:hypothetical protein